MAELLDVVASWPAFVAVLVIFGFAPRAVLRVLVLAYPKTDPRRAELMAELQAVPRLERPLWVFEQLELALFEGLPRRRRAAAVRWRRPTSRAIFRLYPAVCNC